LVADAPPHGKGLYHDHADDHKNGHPNDKPLQQLFSEMRAKKVFYYFGRINGECDKMISVFEPYYEKKIEIFNNSEVASVCGSVIRSVMSSVSATCDATISSSKLTGKVLRRFTIDKSIPDWPSMPILNASIVAFELPETIRDIVSYKKMVSKVLSCRLQVASNPFDMGSCRLAYYGRILHSDTKSEKPEGSSKAMYSDLKPDDVVLKEMQALPKIADLDRQRYMTDLEVQTVASKLAFMFNDLLKHPMKLKFLMAKIVRFDSEKGDIPRFMASEKKFRGVFEFVKYYGC
jgi:hypothetical protein